MEKKKDSMKEDRISEFVKLISWRLQKSAVSHLNATKEVKICEIPKNLRELHCEDFAPKFVSIGPIHPPHESSSMEEHKLRLLSSLLRNMDNHGDHNQNGISIPDESVVSQQQEEEEKLKCLVVAIKELEPNARACYGYSERMDRLKSDAFVMMMLVDGCFIIQLLRLYAKQCELGDVEDPIFRSSSMLPILQRDLLLFENQLPFMVIEKIFNIASSNNERYSLADLTIKFFNYLLPRDREILNKCKAENEPHHLLGLFRSSFILSSFTLEHTTSSVLQQTDIDQVQERSFIWATKLKEAGVVCKKRENGDLLDIEFKDGKLYIPPLLIDDHMGAVLLNFVAYEQCNQSSIKPYFTQYLLFIHRLLKSAKVVEHLESEGIIRHVLDSNEDVAVLFNKLGKGLIHAIDDCYLSELVLKKDPQISELLTIIDGNMKQTTTTTHSPSGKFQKISRVPSNLKPLSEQDFGPKAVSIGPFHYRSTLCDMKEDKLRLFKSLLDSVNHDGEPITPSAVILNRLLVAMMDLEAYTRACYSEAFDHLSSNDFVLMMLHDGCFVVQLLRLYAKCDSEHVDDPIFTELSWKVPILQHDLILFENQLPLTVLKSIFNITSSRDEQFSLEELALKFFDSLLPRKKRTCILSNGKVDCNPHHLLGLFGKVDSNPHHLLGLFRSSFLPYSNKFDRKSSLLRTRRRQSSSHCDQQSLITINNEVQERNLIRSVTKLKEAGVMFKKSENEDLLDIEFKDGKLYIPPLLIDGHTGSVLLNFVAYEQCNQYSKPYFTQYLLFIECLLKSSKDVEHLQSEGIIDHDLDSNKDVAVLFNKLCKEVVRAVDDFYLSEPVLKDVKEYTKVKKHRMWAKWKEDYAEWKHAHFRSPWATLSFLAAILLLVFTAIQTLFSVLAYVSPRS